MVERSDTTGNRILADISIQKGSQHLCLLPVGKLSESIARYIAALISWGIALFEYLIQLPANRIGHTQLSLAQLKIMQEVITICVFVPLVIVSMKERLRWDFVWVVDLMVAEAVKAFGGRK